MKMKSIRRDRLRKIEEDAQRRWEEKQVFRAEPRENPPQPGEKFFGNFPFPYMNGFLHLGHAFTISKLEFAAAYHRLRGVNVLLPFAFHCTGMPIKAAADKLARELQQFGYPPVFPIDVKQDKIAAKAKAEAGEEKKHKGKKAKAAAKSAGQVFQWEIMRDGFGLSDSEISEFQDPEKWLKFFPPRGVEDLKAFGLGCDWRRSFITTDMNPFFDNFVKWQVRKLKSKGKIVKDVRYTIFSPFDGQPCADHDRARGEGVQPQEYIVIKMEVVAPLPSKFGSVLKGRKVFLAAATLRPETMYGQTNAWVLPDAKYGAFEINDTDVFILTHRAALNLAYQKYSRVPEKPTCLVELTGYDLIGLPLKSPLAFSHIIYALPMLTIPTDKGTGIVTSVPSDAPDDYMALHNLKSKSALREKYGVKEEWVMPFEVIPIIKEGTLTVGEFVGREVQEAKLLIKRKLIEAGEGIIYYEPEEQVVSRSGDECVVALTDQWYITYGETEWKKMAEECLSGMSLYSDETRHGFEHTIGWLNQWACSRSFGLGTRIPWDEEFLVESLSDSTIYMAYYTIAHFLHNGDMYGASRSEVKPEQMTDDVWDFIFCDGPYPKSSDIPSSILKKMKKEFEYWYPFDLRVSGKDLIQNHLAFCIYNHTAIMTSNKYWPRGFRCNGHLLLNGEKMSKSTGNFRTLRQAIEEFSADATRFSLADAGDGVDDANFVFVTANAAILRLTKEIAWIEQVLASDSCLRTGPPSTYADRVFANEINIAVHRTELNYRDYMFREALKTGFYDLQAARDEYKFSCGAGGMNRDLVWRFVDVQTRLITPICPHYAEYVWRELLNKEGFVVNAGWPVADASDLTLQSANKYLQDFIVLMRKLFHKQVSGSNKGHKGTPVTLITGENKLTGLVYVNEHFDGWKAECLKILQIHFNSDTRTFSSDKLIQEALQKSSIGHSKDFRETLKLCMPFIRSKMDEAIAIGARALDLTLPFGEIEVLHENLDLIKRQIGLQELHVLYFANPDARALAGPHVKQIDRNPPFPGSPTVKRSGWNWVAYINKSERREEREKRNRRDDLKILVDFRRTGWIEEGFNRRREEERRRNKRERERRTGKKEKKKKKRETDVRLVFLSFAASVKVQGAKDKSIYVCFGQGVDC